MKNIGCYSANLFGFQKLLRQKFLIFENKELLWRLSFFVFQYTDLLQRWHCRPFFTCVNSPFLKIKKNAFLKIKNADAEKTDFEKPKSEKFDFEKLNSKKFDF